MLVAARDPAGRAFARGRRPRGGSVRCFHFLVLLLLIASPPASAFGPMRLSVERVSHPALEVRDLRFEYEPDEGRARLEIAALRLAGQRWSRLRLDCPQARMSLQALECRGGRLRADGRPLPFRLELTLDTAGRRGQLVIADGAGGRVVARLATDGSLRAKLSRLSLQSLASWLPALADWQAEGHFDGEAEWLDRGGAERIRVRGTLTGGGFSSADGLRAGEALGVELELDAHTRSGGWDWSASLGWHEGASFWDPFYLVAGPVLEASGRLRGDRLEVRQANVTLDGVERLAASASVDLARAHVDEAALSLAGADLARVGPRFLAPLLSPARADQLRFAGSVSAGLRLVDGTLVELDAVFVEAGFSLAAPGGGVAFGPLSGHLPWRAGEATRARLQIEGGRWGKLALGAFDLEVALAGTGAHVERARVPLLDGAVVLEGLALRREEAGWSGSGSAFVEPLSMPLVSEALGLPAMTGTLSASLPGLRLRPGEIVLDGALVVSVFDGYLRASGLRVREPFGVGAYLSADVVARHLDLAQLTDTFSFGSISGFIDADVLGLELAHWRPQAFDARIVSSEGRYRKRISQRAVQNISALGGAGAMAALQRSLLGLFETFGYRELGLRCVLRGAVCEMSGIEDGDLADGGFRIIRGGGVPALDVIGYNRRVDWKELVDRLQRVLAENVSPVVR